MNTITYGTSSAPHLAIRTLQQLGKDEAERFPRASNIILNDFHVDDLLTGSNDVNNVNVNVIELYDELKVAMNSGGLNIRKWVSNCSDLMNHIPEFDREVEFPFVLNLSTINTLVISCNPVDDNFYFKINKNLIEL